MNTKQDTINQILWHLGRMVTQQLNTNNRDFLGSVDAIEHCCKQIKTNLQTRRIIVDPADDDEL